MYDIDSRELEAFTRHGGVTLYTQTLLARTFCAGRASSVKLSLACETGKVALQNFAWLGME